MLQPEETTQVENAKEKEDSKSYITTGYQVSQQVFLYSNLDISNWHDQQNFMALPGPVIIVLFWIGDGAARHRSALRGIEPPCHVMTHLNKRLKFEKLSIQNFFWAIG